jgi:choline dehydrogenase-like flavoprotein
MALKKLSDFKNKLIETENVIIGSGAGGSTSAFELLKLNKNSLILEEGPNINNIDKSNIGKNIVNLYKNNGATPLYSFNGGPLIGYGQGSCVGGSTFVNAGYFSNTPEWVFNNWIDSNKIKISYSEFQNLINEIKTEIKVSTEKVLDTDGDSKALYDFATNKKLRVEKCERFSNGEPYKEKNNMNNTYHQKLYNENIDIIHDCRVNKIICENKLAKKVIAEDKINKKKYEIKFKNIFICCGPISSPHLLIKNKLIKYKKNQNNFEFHINLKILVKFKNKVNLNINKTYNSDDPVSIFFMREYEKEGALLSAANSELPYLLATASHFNDTRKKEIYENFTNYAMYVYQIKPQSSGQVKDFFGVPFVSYNYNHTDLAQIKIAIKRISNFFLDNGAECIFYPVESSNPIQNIKQSNNLIENLNAKKLHLVSVHGMSSLRSGEEENTLTDFFGKLKQFDNIYINDASILPSNTGESPQASIMAMVKNNIKNIKL